MAKDDNRDLYDNDGPEDALEGEPEPTAAETAADDLSAAEDAELGEAEPLDERDEAEDTEDEAEDETETGAAPEDAFVSPHTPHTPRVRRPGDRLAGLVVGGAVVLAVLALGLFLAFSGGKEEKLETVPSNAIAVVDGEAVAKADFDRLLDQARRVYKAQKREFPAAGSAPYRQLRDDVTSFLVRQAKIEDEADAMGVSVADADIDKEIAAARQQLGGEKQFQAELKKQGLTTADIRYNLRSQLLQQKLYDKVTNDVKVSEQEVRSYYDKNKSQFAVPASREVRHILVTEEKVANDVYQQLLAGGDFAALAKRYSQDPGSKEQGGKLTVSKGQTVPPFDKVAFAAKTNTVSKPVKTQFGWHIIEPLAEVKPKRAQAFAEVKADVRERLLQEKKQKAANAFLERLDREVKAEAIYAVGYEPQAAPTQTGTQTETQGG